MLDSSYDYRKTGKYLSVKVYMITIRGKLAFKTSGWEICCKCNDEFISWELLSDLKNVHLIQVAKFAIIEDIEHETTFS